MNIKMNSGQEKARLLNKKFEEDRPSKAGKWDIKTCLIDLMEEVGELSNAVLVEEGNKSEKRRMAKVDNSLGDIQFALYLIADKYGLDLEEEYEKVLVELEERLKKKHFD